MEPGWRASYVCPNRVAHVTCGCMSALSMDGVRPVHPSPP